jgi:glycolate oxidase
MLKIAAEEEIRIRSFGHAGDGNLHIYVCRDELPEEAWKRKVASVMNRLYAAAGELRGEVSGEHGIGHAKRVFLRESLGEKQIALMRGIKRVFDPAGILNPGKVFE